VYLGSKVKDSEWRNFGGERLLGAVNGDQPGRKIQGIKKQSREGGLPAYFLFSVNSLQA